MKKIKFFVAMFTVLCALFGMTNCNVLAIPGISETPVVEVQARSKRSRKTKYKIVWRTTETYFLTYTDKEILQSECDQILKNIAKPEISAYQAGKRANIDSSKLSFEKWSADTWLDAKASSKYKKIYKCKVTYSTSDNPGKVFYATVTKTVKKTRCRLVRKTQYYWKKISDKTVLAKIDPSGLSKETKDQILAVGAAQIAAYIDNESEDEAPTPDSDLIEYYDSGIEEVVSEKKIKTHTYNCYIKGQDINGTVFSAMISNKLTYKKVAKTVTFYYPIK